MKHLLGIQQLSKAEILGILSRAAQMRELLEKKQKSTCLKDKTVTTLFYENSTRTKTSFELAAKNLSANLSSLAVSTSSVNKGESLIDTGRTLDFLQSDIIVIRHQVSGTPLFLSKNISAAVVNAGDGMHEHPTQALLDFLTMQRTFGSFEGLNVTLLGDIKHSRVARSNAIGLNKLGAKVTAVAPYTLIPQDFERYGVTVTTDTDEAIKNADVVMPLRIQLERQQQGLFPSVAEYNDLFGLTENRLKLLKDKAVIMHPGPINRGVEIDSAAADAQNSLINPQVFNGVAVRMAVLSLIGEEL